MTTSQITVDRSRWLRGEGQDEAFLVHPDTKMPCVSGYVALACGIHEGALLGVRTLWDLNEAYYRLLPAKLRQDSYRQYLIDATNDVPGVPDLLREDLLTDLLSRVDIQLEFVG